MEARSSYLKARKDYLLQLQAERGKGGQLWSQQAQFLVATVGEYQRAAWRLCQPLNEQLDAVNDAITHLQTRNQQATLALQRGLDDSSLNGSIVGSVPSGGWLKEGYLFRKRHKGIGPPWKRVYAKLTSTGTFQLWSAQPHGHPDDHGHYRPKHVASVNVLLCQVQRVCMIDSVDQGPEVQWARADIARGTADAALL